MRFPLASSRTAVASVVLCFLITSAPHGWAADAAAKAPEVRGHDIVFTPAKVRFGQVALGRTKKQIVTVKNVGKSDNRLLQVVTNGNGFTLSGLELPMTLASGESFTFTSTFAPVSLGATNGSVSFVWGNREIENPISLLDVSGFGTDGQLTVYPPSMDFGSVQIGVTSSQAGKLIASGSQVTIASAVSSNAEYTCAGVTFPITLPPGGSQGFKVMFAPQDNSAAHGTITFLDDTGNTLAVENLAGVGILPQNHRVDLSWDASTSHDVIGYNVYRGNTTGGPYRQINSVLDASTVYSDTSVNDGNTYYYVVTAVNSNEQESAYSNEAQAVIPQDGSEFAGSVHRTIVIRPTFNRRVAGGRNALRSR